MLSPVYIAEIAPAKDRGKLVSYNQLAIVGGFMVVYFVNYFIALSGDDTWLNDIGWRYMFASELVPVSIFLLLLYFVPDTPRSLVSHDKEGEALEILKKVNTESEAQSILSDIKNTLVVKSIFGVVKNPSWVIIAICLTFFVEKNIDFLET